ncbi:MAG: CHASE domain-containing protein [Rubrivivax sp.]
MNQPAGPAAPPAWQVVAFTALAYAVVGWAALALAQPPSYAVPLYPPAGIALAAVALYGRPALAGVAGGAFLVNVVLSASRGQIETAALVLPAVIALGATLQAAAGAALLKRFVPQPLVLAGPGEIVRAGLLGGFVACLVSATMATLALVAVGSVGRDQAFLSWGTWWVGDTLGVLIGAPLALTLVGRPREDWQPRRRTVGLPLLAATLLLAAASLAVNRREEEHARQEFEHDASQLASAAAARLQRPLLALRALEGAWYAAGGLDERRLHEVAARWFEGAPTELRALGVALRVARRDLPAFEARARSEGQPGYRVFEREAAAAAAGDADVAALRFIEPAEGNTNALGVNTLSIAATRAAVLAARDGGQPAASGGFRLTQATEDETGFVVYQAVYDGPADDTAERRARWHGLVFATVSAERLLRGLDDGRRYVRWCLVDKAPNGARPRLAGAAGCEQLPKDGWLEVRHALPFAGRDFELRVQAQTSVLPDLVQGRAWLFSVVGLFAAATLGALLLTVTGRARRIEQAVDARTGELQREVQERRHAEHALRESEARLRSILDNVPIGVMFLDPQGRLAEVNPHLAEMLGRPAQWLLHASLDEISHPEEQPENRRQLAALLGGEVAISRRQMRLQRADGRLLWVRTHLTVLREDAGPPARLAGVVEDITEHLRLEESERALDRAEAASRAKSEFVSRMSHELRTPLNAMIGFAQLLSLDRDPALAPHQRDWTAQIQRAGWHLLEMINDTLDLARIESGAVQLSLKTQDLPALVSASLALVSTAARQRGVDVGTDLAADAAGVHGDELRIKQVLTNLLSNAIKYNREGGSVVVTARRRGDTVEVAVRDTGLGMTPEQMAALFQPYNRLGREASAIEGTGIGLVISRRLAELMGGGLEVSSAAGQGSVFTLRLPAAGGSAAAPAEAPPRPPYQGRRVHYIEDNETNVEIMRGILLQRPQVRMEVSTIGLDGLTAIRRQRPDLILLDMQLPDISGLELLRHIKQDDEVAGIPVIVVSADATTARMQEALTLGAAHYVTKPVDIQRFLKTLDETLEAMETKWG